MTERYLTITPRDPVIARDGRPFSAGSRMKPVDWLYPSVVAGSVRTLLGKAVDPAFGPATCTALKAVVVQGALPVAHASDDDVGTLCLPAPKDFTLDFTFAEDGETRYETFASRPWNPGDMGGAGCDLPRGLHPALLHPSPEEDFKPGAIPVWWSRARMIEWLCDPLGARFSYHEKLKSGGFFEKPGIDERMHVQIREGFGTADDGMLYSTSALDLSGLVRAVPERRKNKQGGEGVRIETDGRRERPRPLRLSLAVRIEEAGSFDAVAANVNELQTIGGERRIARFQGTADDASSLWAPPKEIRDALGKAPTSKAGDGKGRPLVRLVLATPGLFEAGWHPDFLERDDSDPLIAERDRPLIGVVPGTETSSGTGVKVKLVGACVERWRPISGWSLEHGKRGPKPVRRLVPAGSVYFFEVLNQAEGGDPSRLADRWLKSVCTTADNGQAARDGFGLALWGVWDAPASSPSS